MWVTALRPTAAPQVFVCFFKLFLIHSCRKHPTSKKAILHHGEALPPTRVSPYMHKDRILLAGVNVRMSHGKTVWVRRWQTKVQRQVCRVQLSVF